MESALNRLGRHPDESAGDGLKHFGHYRGGVAMGLWNFFRVSLRRGRALVRVSRTLGQPITSVEMLLSGAAESAQEELYDLIVGDPALYALLQKYGATRNDLPNIYHGLRVGGAGQWVRGHWVAASALYYGFTLEFVLSRFRQGEAAHKNPREIWEPIAFAVVEYFAKGKVGRVQSS